MKTTNLDTVYQFDESPWLAKFIVLNVEQRATVKKKFFTKIMINDFCKNTIGKVVNE